MSERAIDITLEGALIMIAGDGALYYVEQLESA
jgi:hypothetical protein